MVTGTADYQQMFQNQLWEVVNVPGDDRNFIMPIVKLSDDSQTSSGGSAVQIVSGSVQILDFPTYGEYDYIDMSYSGTVLQQAVFKVGGGGGGVVSTLLMAYDGSGNLISVTKV